MICDWRKRADGVTGSFVSMRLESGSSADCHSNRPSFFLSLIKSKFQRFESSSDWRCSSAVACWIDSSGDDGKPKRHRLTRDKQPVLGTIRGRPRQYIRTSSETGAARILVLIFLSGGRVLRLLTKSDGTLSNKFSNTTRITRCRSYYREILCTLPRSSVFWELWPFVLGLKPFFDSHTRRYYAFTTTGPPALVWIDQSPTSFQPTNRLVFFKIFPPKVWGPRARCGRFDLEHNPSIFKLDAI